MDHAVARPSNTASIVKDGFCKACGWPVVHVCCNDAIPGVDPLPDYWGYCSNKGCANHAGEEWGMDGDPEFMFRSRKSVEA